MEAPRSIHSPRSLVWGRIVASVSQPPKSCWKKSNQIVRIHNPDLLRTANPSEKPTLSYGDDMKGEQQVIDQLNLLLTLDLTAIDVYFVQSRMYEDWGFAKLKDHFIHEMEEEQGHASRLIERILFLEGTPNLHERAAYQLHTDTPNLFRANLGMERVVLDELKKGIALCESVSDYQSRVLLEDLLKDTEEDHLYWFEIQLGLIEKVGLENYLQSMI